MLVHIMDQKELAPGDGPIGLILAPTRELSMQVKYNLIIFNINIIFNYNFQKEFVFMTKFDVLILLKKRL